MVVPRDITVVCRTPTNGKSQCNGFSTNSVRSCGFCLPEREQARLVQSPPADPDEFSDAVFAAEGLDPRLFPQLRGQVRARVQSGLSPAAK